jgi:transcriptional regulator with XRE-family HTH domain
MVAGRETHKTLDVTVARKVEDWTNREREQKEKEKGQHAQSRPSQSKSKSRCEPGPLENRVIEVASHISWFGFRTQARLSRDSGVSPAAISRLIRGQSQPTLALALRLTRALSKRAGQRLDVSDVFSLDGTYAISACALMGCRACVTPQAYEQQQAYEKQGGEGEQREDNSSQNQPSAGKSEGGK